MNKIIKLSNEDRKALFQTVAVEKSLQPVVVEKDFWTCFMLNHLFEDSQYNGLFVFKGGTSLSKGYHIIDRFSEDIDLILDWRKLGGTDETVWEPRSRNQQNKYNEEMNAQAAEFYRSELVPNLNDELSKKLGPGRWMAIDENDTMVINFNYPKLYPDTYIRAVVRLEIGPLAEWTPSHNVEITSFVAELHPNLFETKSFKVRTIDIERTFWEKLTILHKLAFYPENKLLPARYARHLYDVYCMSRNEKILSSAFKEKELLKRDVMFKEKFYYAKSARYEDATLETIRLLPAPHIEKAIREDYKAMKNMIYGYYPSYEEIMTTLKELEEEIHKMAD